jgi:hypothetical protein
MAKFSKKMGGKEVGDAKVYAKPHDMSGKMLSEADLRRSVSQDSYSNSKIRNASSVNSKSPSMGVSIGANTKENMNGEITMRGYGAATKGIKCRGPMA